MEEEIECPVCLGSGEIYDPEIDDVETCTACEGTGVIN